MGSRAPVPPKVDNVERQYGENADVYAEVRADTAKALGRAEEADAWGRVQAQVERPDGSDRDPPDAD